MSQPGSGPRAAGRRGHEARKQSVHLVPEPRKRFFRQTHASCQRHAPEGFPSLCAGLSAAATTPQTCCRPGASGPRRSRSWSRSQRQRRRRRARSLRAAPDGRDGAGVDDRAALIRQKAASTLVRNVRSHCASSSDSMSSQWFWKAALLTRMSRRPISPTVRATALRQNSDAVRSPGTRSARPPDRAAAATSRTRVRGAPGAVPGTEGSALCASLRAPSCLAFGTGASRVALAPAAKKARRARRRPSLCYAPRRIRRWRSCAS